METRCCFKTESPLARESSNASETGSLSIVVLGASGDLAKKTTIFRALFHMYQKGFLPPKEVHIFGYARTKISDDELRDQLREYLIPAKDASSKQVEDVWDFLNLIKYISGSCDSEEGFRLLDKEISEHEYSKNSAEGSSRRLFYLALPPSVYPSVCKMIKTCCMNKSNLGGWTRVVVEKPFGKDLESAEELSTQIGELFEEPQIYRIGHYLGRELVQKMLVLRFANQLFLSLWNRDNIDNVQIVFKEDFGTEGCGGYFDQFGIIRDIIQNHLLQVFCLVAMEKPVSLKPEHIRDEKVKVLESVVPISDDEVVLGQYEGYRDDPTVPDESNTPTFASVILRIHNERWEGVPFILKAGKALNSRKAEIRVQFKDVPGDIFKDVPHEIFMKHRNFCGQKHRRNGFLICLQPSEAIYMKLMYKLPDLEMSTYQSEQELSFWRRNQGVTISEAYESLILDTIRGDQQQFVRRDELKASWKIFTPLLHRIDRGEFKPLLDIATDPLLSLRPDNFTPALWNLNEKDQGVSRHLRRRLVPYINGWSDEIPEVTMEDQSLIMDRSRREVEFLKLTVTSTSSFQMDNWLVMMYTRSRKQFLKMLEFELKPDKSAAQMSTIKKCINHFSIVFKILIPNEQVFCEQVFGTTSPIYRECFMKFCLLVKQEFVSSIQDKVLALMNSSDTFLVFQTIHGLIVQFQSLFPNDDSITADMVDLERKFGEAARDYYFRDDDVPPEIGNFYSCEPHPITIQAVNRLHTAFKDREILKALVQAYPNPEVQVREGQRSMISYYIDWNLNKLEASLESTFKKSYVYELQGVSVMANVIYIQEKAMEFGFELSDGWLKEQASKLQGCFQQYKQDTVELLKFFKEHNMNATGSLLWNMLSCLDLDELENDRSLVPNCREFLKRFRALLNGNGNQDIPSSSER